MEYQDEINVVRTGRSLSVQYSVMDYTTRWEILFNNYTYEGVPYYHNRCGVTLYESEWLLTPEQVSANFDENTMQVLGPSEGFPERTNDSVLAL